MVDSVVTWIVALAGVFGACAYFLVTGLGHLAEVRRAWRRFKGRHAEKVDSHLMGADRGAGRVPGPADRQADKPAGRQGGEGSAGDQDPGIRRDSDPDTVP
jgi:hypothetical protein